MAIILTQTLTAVAYGIVSWWLFWIALNYQQLGPSVIGIALHLLVVAIRTAIILSVPGADSWDWSTIHRVTISVAAICALWGGLRLRWWE